MQVNKVIIPLLFLATGFVSAYIIFSPTTEKQDVSPGSSFDRTLTSSNNSKVVNPFTVTKNHRSETQHLARLGSEISLIKEQLQGITMALQEQTDQLTSLASSQSPGNSATDSIVRPYRNTRFDSLLSQRLYSLDNLIKGGINQALAEDIVRRKNIVELKTLQLQDRAKREGYLNTQRYYDELDALEQGKVNLREELGDDRYDEYLFNSKQNNRIRINSVMLGSAAEQVGILKSDVVLSYDDTKVYNWQELKNATTEGKLGEYVSISILRNAQVISFTVPRGPLGVQLGATRIQP